MRVTDPLFWRVGVVVGLPALVIAWYAVTHDVVADSAGGLAYRVHVNHLTDEACISFPGRATPKGLADLACRTDRPGSPP